MQGKACVVRDVKGNSGQQSWQRGEPGASEQGGEARVEWPGAGLWDWRCWAGEKVGMRLGRFWRTDAKNLDYS